MNTLTHSPAKERIIITLIVPVLLAILLPIGRANAQTTVTDVKKTSAGFALYSQVSANGYGGSTVPTLYLKYKRRTFMAGPVIGNQHRNFSGVQLNYTYALTGPCTPGYCAGIPELAIFFSAAYNHNAFLGKHAMWEENIANPAAAELDVDRLTFKSVEFFAGAALKVKLSKRLRWVNAVGLGAYNSIGFPNRLQLFYEARNVGIILRTGLSFEVL